MRSSDYVLNDLCYDSASLAKLSESVADCINGDQWGNLNSNGVIARCNVDVLTVTKMLLDNWEALNYQVIYP